MAVHVDKNNPQNIVISSRNAEGDLEQVGTISVTYATVAGAEVATLAITAEAGVTLGGTTAAVTLTFA